MVPFGDRVVEIATRSSINGSVWRGEIFQSARFLFINFVCQ